MPLKRAVNTKLRQVCHLSSCCLIAQLFRVTLLLGSLLVLAACDQVSDVSSGLFGESEEAREVTELSLAVSKRLVDLPWLLPIPEGDALGYEQRYHVRLNIEVGDYADNIDRFVNQEVDAISISNIDAIAQLVRQDVESDVILITGYSNGNEAILLPSNEQEDLSGKMLALTEFSTAHYLLDRYLVRNQIDFDAVQVINEPGINLLSRFNDGEVHGVVASNPILSRLQFQENAQRLFDSRQIPNEISELIVIRRDRLLGNTDVSQALLARWFKVMEDLQSTLRSGMFDTMAGLADISREELEQQWPAMEFNNTPNMALSSIRRDRIMRKTMRHIRYFVERHGLTGVAVYVDWVSYPGRNPALLHYNAQPLQLYVAPPETNL